MATYYVRKLAAKESPTSPTGYFYFDGSDAAAADPNAVWTDESNADDGATSTVAFTTSSGGETTAQLAIEGTNAPASGDTINTVHLRVWYGPGTTTVAGNSVVRVYTDGKGESLGLFNPDVMENWFGDADHLELLSTPSGGWTWAKVQALEIYFWQNAGSDRLEIGKAEIIVNVGDSSDNPFGTIDKAANTVAAADTVYVGAGTYRESVTMDTAGTSGNQITYIADVDGSQTGDAGLVVISAFTDSNTVTRTFCLDPDGKTFVTWRGFVMQGGTQAVVYSLNTTNDNYEGVIFEDCVFVSGPDNLDYGIRLDMNAATTPTAAGLTVRHCVFSGAGVVIRWDGNETADQNLKITMENCLVVGTAYNNVAYSAFYFDKVTSGTFASGGVTFTNNTAIIYIGVYVEDGASTTYPVAATNNLLIGTNPLNKQTSNDGALTSAHNTIMGTNTNVTAGTGDRTETSTWLLGGIADYPLRRFLGWSPYAPFEPMRNNADDDWTSLIGDASSTFAPADDLYGNPRPMSQAGFTQSIYYMDGSDAAASQDGAGWTGVTNFDDSNTATLASTSTIGTISADYIMMEGTVAPTSGGTISSVEVRLYCGTTTNLAWAVHVDGWGEEVWNSGESTNDGWGPWRAGTTPTGGWTWAKVAALECRAWAYAAGTSEVGTAQVRVSHAVDAPTDDRGAVESRARAEQETTTVRTGANALRFEGAGFHEWLIPVAAASTTISIYGRYDSNHTGSLPKMEVFNIPGVADQSDLMVAAVNTWEELTATFTPTTAGVCRVRATSQDTSATGQAFFDDLTVT